MASARRNILVLIKGLGIGGAERLISEGARFWDRGAFRYSVAYVLPWKDQLVPELEDLGVDTFMIGSRRGLGPSAVGRLRHLIAEEEIDLVHAHLPTMGILARLASPVPVVYTEHNLSDSYRRPTRWAARATYGRNSAVIAVSDAVARGIASWPGPEATVIPNGVAVNSNREGLPAARDELGLGPTDVLIAHVGNIRPGKGHDILIDAAQDLLHRRPSVTIVSIGVEKFPGDLERVRARARGAGLGDRLRFLGRRADALDFVAAADLFVNPSEVEGLPLAVLEAMALERPVVATAAGGVPTIVIDGETGILVEPGDPAALSKGIEQLLDDRDAADRMARNGRDLVESQFGLGHMIEETESIYRKVLG